MDEFVTFLIAGLVTIAIFLIFFGGIVSWVPVPTTYPVYREVKNISGASLVGPESISAHKRYVTYFDVSYKQNDDIFYLGEKEIFNGLLFGNNALKYRLNLSDVKSMRIDFRITKTNEYGPLVIKINECVVKEDIYSPGEYNITLPSSVLNDLMNIEIYATSSGWKIWAPNIYRLENIKFVVNSFSRRENEFGFEVPESVYNNFENGKIEIKRFEKSLGKLVIKLNANKIFSDNVADSLSLRFNKSKIKPGYNILLFDSSENSEFSGNADILIFYNEPKKHRIEMPFNITQSDYNTLKTGKIEFKIISLEEHGGLSVKIIHENETLFSAYETAEEKNYIFEFDKSHVNRGLNTVLIESVDDAVFSVADAEINLS